MILDKLYNKTSILATSIAVTLANWQLCLFNNHVDKILGILGPPHMDNFTW